MEEKAHPVEHEFRLLEIPVFGNGFQVNDVRCFSCYQNPIIGIYFNCMNCKNFKQCNFYDYLQAKSVISSAPKLTPLRATINLTIRWKSYFSPNWTKTRNTNALHARCRFYRTVTCARTVTISFFVPSVMRKRKVSRVCMQTATRSTMCSRKSFDFI